HAGTLKKETGVIGRSACGNKKKNKVPFVLQPFAPLVNASLLGKGRKGEPLARLGAECKIRGSRLLRRPVGSCLAAAAWWFERTGNSQAVKALGH
ncbi:hypothetical protein, partial [uncultured Thiodictyon sp.]|uniref:hypothetical protein n=1 Tax=uncultured Thiodictyon sp. TaxID=1846217 RepID=UPI0025FCF038